MRIEGRVALVTGAARRLGRAIAGGLAAAGARVVVHYGRSRAQAEEAVGELSAAGAEAVALQAELSSPERIDELFTAIGERFGRLDILVNSAASFVCQEFDRVTPRDWDRVLAVNLRAPFLCTQRAARLMRSSPREGREPAAIVNVGDLSAVQVWPRYAQHGVSKAGLLHLTRVSALELAPSVRVNAVIPGAILPPPGVDPESGAWRRRGAEVPVGRTGEPAEVASAVLFLVANDFLTGVLLPVDGGEHLTARTGD